MTIAIKKVSKRGKAYVKFAARTFAHIERYTVPQYGDEGNDPLTNYSSEDCIKAIEKYIKRFGKNSREGQELLDLLKISHYAQVAYDKLVEEKGTGKIYSDS